MLRSIRSASAPLLVAAGVALMGSAFGVASAQAAEFSDLQRGEIKDIVREYLLENPEVIAEAIMILRDRQQQAEDAQAKDLLAQNADALFHNANDAVLGNPKGDVTLVEFFDYRCGYCKAVFPSLNEVITKDGNVRVVMKEMPILGPASMMAAQWSVAAHKLGGYESFHTALMEHKGNVTEELLAKFAKDAGLNPDKVKELAASSDVQDELKESLDLARTLGISGTPAFVVGDVLVPGAIGGDQLAALIAQQRAAQK
jgi:protein-disulfide isomerase